MDAVATTTAAQLFSTECGVRFSEYYDTSPPLPRPLRSRFPLKFVTAAGMKSETRSVAPLNDKEKSQIIEDGLEHYCVTNADDTTMRYVKRNIIYMNKAAEFALIHQELHDGYKKTLGKIETFSTSVSGLLSLLLVIPIPGIPDKSVSTLVAVGTLCIAAVKSFVTTSGIDTLKVR